MAAFTNVPLFGGAIAADLPNGYFDVSNIREVPDNQEIYLNARGLQSIVVDILERVDEATAATDEDALKYHYEDIVAGPGETTNFWSSGNVAMSKMPNIPAYSIFATQNHLPEPNPRPGHKQPDFTGIMMLLLRLKEQKTDVVITVNVPHVPGEYQPEEIDLPAQKLGPLLTNAGTIRQKIFETFEIKDFSLFVNEEE